MAYNKNANRVAVGVSAERKRYAERDGTIRHFLFRPIPPTRTHDCCEEAAAYIHKYIYNHKGTAVSLGTHEQVTTTSAMYQRFVSIFCIPSINAAKLIKLNTQQHTMNELIIP
jgi:hypothetical protein